jgi:peptide-methionine (S)-S-oxide reductase
MSYGERNQDMKMKSYVLGSVVLAALAATAMHLSAASGATTAPGPTAAPKGSEQLVLAGGCFWGMEAVFEQLKGVSSVVAGYSGGSADTAHYEMVSTGDTGHAESVRITFDPSQISLDQLFDVFFTVAHDPTELNRQGPDEGSQYRSAIFYADDAQKTAAEAYVKHLEAAKTYSAPIVTQVVPFRAFYPAEGYHQHFVQNHPDYPYVVFNDLPKLKHLREQFPQLVKH